jgi:hypothetical protein
LGEIKRAVAILKQEVAPNDKFPMAIPGVGE